MSGDPNKKDNNSQVIRRRYETTSSVHNPEPDYSKPLFQIPSAAYERMFGRLSFLYGQAVAEEFMPELERVLRVYYAHKPEIMIKREKDINPAERFTEEDVILITYGDLIRGNDRSPLTTLSKFCGAYLNRTINTLHILPFFPYSSDRGFSIIDFEAVDPNLGTWADIEDLEQRYQLMFDGVINHVSTKSRWFQEFLNGDVYYGDFFIDYGSTSALTPEQKGAIFRPRTSDILTPFDTINGKRYVWTTFSDDQIDLNYHNPNVLMRVIEILLNYVRHGADIIRLDAITYLWAEPGTPCVHLDQTHEIVKLFRDVLDTVAPTCALITETNVPHDENISYFGSGSDEAQMVYNFALPPLVLHTFYTENAGALSDWAAGLENLSNTTTFFNFLDSHDGVGLMAVKNILTQDEIDNIVEQAGEHGGLISYKTGENGKDVPYEINITWYSAMNLEDTDETVEFQVKRFVASRAVGLVLQGVPGIYLHSLFGSRNDREAVKHTKSKRAINRTVLSGEAIYKALEDPRSQISILGRKLGRLGSIRTTNRPFHPNGPQKILKLAPELFTVFRSSPEGDQHILSIINIANKVVHAKVQLSEIGIEEKYWKDLVGKAKWIADNGALDIILEPYDVIWLQPLSELELKGNDK